jgi:hypothetical protein
MESPKDGMNHPRLRDIRRFEAWNKKIAPRRQALSFNKFEHSKQP